MNEAQARADAQQLVDLRVRIRDLEIQYDTLRLGLIGYVNDHGAISCNGGTVSPREHHERATLDRDALRSYLISKLKLQEATVDRAFDAARKVRDQMPNISVRLDP